jgi:hypothetical protein
MGTMDKLAEMIFRRQIFYTFLRQKRKPRRGEEKQYQLPNNRSDFKSFAEWAKHCQLVTGVLPSPVVPIKQPRPNAKCNCGSTLKAKKCCYR